MLESKYQARLIKKILDTYPGSIVLKNDEQYLQGVPDIIILFGTCWAALEVKAHTDSEYQPNQEYYINKMNGMSFAAFICPENEDEVLDALQHTFRYCG